MGRLRTTIMTLALLAWSSAAAHGPSVSEALLVLKRGDAFDLALDVDVHVLAAPDQDPHEAWETLRRRVAQGDAARERVRRELTTFLDPRVELRCDTGTVTLAFDLPELDAPWQASPHAAALDAAGRGQRLHAEAQGRFPKDAEACALLVRPPFGDVLLRIRRLDDVSGHGKRPPDDVQLVTPGAAPATFAPSRGEEQEADAARNAASSESESAADGQGSGVGRGRPQDDGWLRILFFGSVAVVVGLSLYFTLREKPRGRSPGTKPD